MMRRTLPAFPKLLGAACLAAALSACGPVVQVGGNAPRPDSLYTLSAIGPAAVPAGVQPVDMARAVTIGLPAVPGALQTLRIPVSNTDTTIQYVKAAQWSEQPARLFQHLLADVLVHQGIAVIDPRSSGQAGGIRLAGQLMTFGVDVRGAPVARVRYDATLTGPDGVRQRRFEREVAVSRVEGAAVARALNAGANAVAQDVADWVKAAR
ncbi:ABC-type transport auxiliary lipoprotein family protein [Sandaracinobacteroides sp. A072]|uniref:ABC-type transport auxiliary lipoprotein family protein n=1 Tax=Sandaracinobacteroides sp. A072 TaxID=3461146 RepID=UPI004041AA81